ncbi:hypothetical protein Hanom_Chr16g01507591 [Helianthus anomalus]
MGRFRWVLNGPKVKLSVKIKTVDSHIFDYHVVYTLSTIIFQLNHHPFFHFLSHFVS